MIHFCRTNGEQLYWLTCDNCHDFTEQYEDEEELYWEAAEKGWFRHLRLNKVFCGMECYKEYMTKKGGER